MPTRHTGSAAERRALDLFIKLSRAYATVMQHAHPSLRSSGITGIQFGVLDAIVHGGAMPISSIAEKNLCSQNSLCSVIDTMERNGLVNRVRSKEDRRVVTVELTDRGRETFDKLWPDHLQRIVLASSHLTPEEIETLETLLRKLGRP